MSESFRDLPRALKIYYLVEICLPLVISIWAIRHSHLPIVIWLAVIFASACAVKPIPHPYGGIIHPISAIIQVAGLMWQPQDMLLGAGIGCFFGLLVFQKTPLSKAALNAAGWSTGAMVAAVVAQLVLLRVQFGLLSLPAAAFLSVIGRFVTNQILFSIFRSLRFGHPFLPHLRLSLTTLFLAELFPLPMIIILAGAAALLKTIEWSLLLTASYLLVLPIPRHKTGRHSRSGELLSEIVADAIGELRVGPKGSFRTTAFKISPIGVMARSLGASLFNACSMGPGSGVRILAAAQVYEIARRSLNSFSIFSSMEAFQRKLTSVLSSSALDPHILPIVLRVGNELGSKATETGRAFADISKR